MYRGMSKKSQMLENKWVEYSECHSKENWQGSLNKKILSDQNSVWHESSSFYNEMVELVEQNDSDGIVK